MLLNKKNGLMPNIFTESDVCELGVTFMASERKFSYDFKYDAEKEEYIYESFSEIFKDQYNNEKEVCWLKKDTIKEIYECVNEDVLAMIPVVSKNNLLCYVIDTSKFEHINEMKQILVGFAEKIDIIKMNDIPMKHTTILILWIARECSGRSRFGLSTKMKKAYMYIHVLILQHSRE